MLRPTFAQLSTPTTQTIALVPHRRAHVNAFWLDRRSRANVCKEIFDHRELFDDMDFELRINRFVLSIWPIATYKSCKTMERWETPCSSAADTKRNVDNARSHCSACASSGSAVLETGHHESAQLFHIVIGRLRDAVLGVSKTSPSKGSVTELWTRAFSSTINCFSGGVLGEILPASLNA
jgi:hypothetical protein